MRDTWSILCTTQLNNMFYNFFKTLQNALNAHMDKFFFIFILFFKENIKIQSVVLCTNTAVHKIVMLDSCKFIFMSSVYSCE